jgi:hypothetical protein
VAMAAMTRAVEWRTRLLDEDRDIRRRNESEYELAYLASTRMNSGSLALISSRSFWGRRVQRLPLFWETRFRSSTAAS